MSKRLKKVTVVVMTMGVAAIGSMASHASTLPPAAGMTEEPEMNIKSTAGIRTSELIGYITIINIKVKVPVKTGFNISPNGTVAVAADKLRLIETQASIYQIKSPSITELTIEIPDVAVSGDVNLVTSEPADAPADAKKLMFVIKKTGVAPALATADDWMTVSVDDYYLDASGTPPALKAKDDAGGGDKIDMKLYEVIKSGRTNGVTFSVIPTFTAIAK